jgi:hypothetical protein
MKRLFFWGVLVGTFVVVSGVGVYAAQSKSTNYEVNEVQFGAGSLLSGSSASYEAQENAGNLVGGITSSANYGASGGYLTANEPYLSLQVNAATVNLGTLSTSSTATGTATFSVRTYVDSGYVVESMNNPPVNEDGKYLSNITSAAASATGTEQFGINLVQNLTSCYSAPANFGANPVPTPTSAFATGIAASGYNACGLFQYNKGDIIAESSGNGWGQTNYTISYIVNIGQLTKAGSYTMTQDLVAVATY